MNIGIIGAGQIGGTLTRRLSALGHHVFIANASNADALMQLAKETGAKAVSPVEAARSGDVVVVTIPEGKIRDLPSDLFAHVADDVVVVDTGNYYPRERDGRIEEIENSPTESQWVQSRLGRPVVKAFNNIYADHLMKLGRPAGTEGRLALPLSGDDARAKKIVSSLIDELGFDPVDNGKLADSWRHQPGTPVYGPNLDAAGVKRALTAASPKRTPQWTGTPDSPGSYDNAR